MAAITYSNIDLSTSNIEVPINPATFTYGNDIPHVVVGYEDPEEVATIPYYVYNSETTTWDSPDNYSVEEYDCSIWKGKECGPMVFATRAASEESGVVECSLLKNLAFEDGQDLKDLACTTYTVTNNEQNVNRPENDDFWNGNGTTAPSVFPFFITGSVRWPKGLEEYPAVYFRHDPRTLSTPQTFRLFLPERLDKTLNISYINDPADVNFESASVDNVYIVNAQAGDTFELYYLFNYTEEEYDKKLYPQYPDIQVSTAEPKAGTVSIYGSTTMGNLLGSSLQNVDDIKTLVFETKTDVDLKIEEATKKPGYITASEIQGNDGMFHINVSLGL